MHDGYKSCNFIHFVMRKKYIRLLIEVADKEAWVNRIEEAGLGFVVKNRFLIVEINEKEFSANIELLTELLHQTVLDYES